MSRSREIAFPILEVLVRDRYFKGMASVVVRAALRSFVSDSAIPQSSKRGMKAVASVENFLDEEIDQDEFDIFAQTLHTAIEESVSTSATTKSRSKSVLREKVWRSFHQLRLKELVDIWRKYFETRGKERFDVIAEQYVNTKLFESLVKTHAPPPKRSASVTQLTDDEENIIRYIAGYVSLKIGRKYDKQSTDLAVEYSECLNLMAVQGDDSSLQAYTAEWIQLVNRGRLFEVNDLTFQLFREIEIKMQSRLIDVLHMHMPGSEPTTERRTEIVETVASELFFWALLSCDISHDENAIKLLRELIELWLTIRGFAVASSWLEQYKIKSKMNVSKKKGLRKNLKKKSMASDLPA